jgi:hypothetical protein
MVMCALIYAKREHIYQIDAATFMDARSAARRFRTSFCSIREQSLHHCTWRATLNPEDRAAKEKTLKALGATPWMWRTNQRCRHCLRQQQ